MQQRTVPSLCKIMADYCRFDRRLAPPSGGRFQSWSDKEKTKNELRPPDDRFLWFGDQQLPVA
jgi:hypothetical protein